MPDCFISYTSGDIRFATYVSDYLKARGLRPYLAELHIVPGAQWSESIRTALRQSPWVIFLASRAACESAYVQQEVGGAVFGGKRLVPVVWDQPPEALPGWARNYQALDLRGLRPEEVPTAVARLAEAIHADKTRGAQVVAALLGGLALLWALGNDEPEPENDA